MSQVRLAAWWRATAPVEEAREPETRWFRIGVTGLHVGVLEPFVPSSKAHPALRVTLDFARERRLYGRSVFELPHARRQLVSKMPHEPLIVDKLMSEIAEKYADRSSGFTRIVKIGQRLGDAAPMVQIELV